MSEELAAVEETARRRGSRPIVWLAWFLLAFFFVNLAGIVFSAVVDSFGDNWFGNWLPQVWTTHYWSDAWHAYDLGQVLQVTLIVSVAVVIVSVLVGVPASYALARRNFPFKHAIMLVFLLPVMVPPIAYGIPLATAMYKFNTITHVQIANSMFGVILANLVPAIPFVVLTMTPFIEQIDPKVESAARMCGASTRKIFTRILLPLLVPGVLAASILVLVRTVGMFELTYLTAGTDSETLVVKLFDSISGAGIRAPQQSDAMAVLYMGMMLVLLVIALRFVNPTQLVTRVAEERDA
ncbi:MAG: ABC transporter permease subunit [Actinobacteria bacterium]|nr:MAG: ABC transporter permease subunit [Actinomycetota bacterium]